MVVGSEVVVELVFAEVVVAVLEQVEHREQLPIVGHEGLPDHFFFSFFFVFFFVSFLFLFPFFLFFLESCGM